MARVKKNSLARETSAFVNLGEISVLTLSTKNCAARLKLERLPIFTDFHSILSIFPPSVRAQVSGVLLQKPSFRMVSNGQLSMLNLPTCNIIFHDKGELATPLYLLNEL